MPKLKAAGDISPSVLFGTMFPFQYFEGSGPRLSLDFQYFQNKNFVVGCCSISTIMAVS